MGFGEFIIIAIALLVVRVELIHFGLQRQINDMKRELEEVKRKLEG